MVELIISTNRLTGNTVMTEAQRIFKVGLDEASKQSIRDNVFKLNGNKISEEQTEEEELFHRSSSKESRAASDSNLNVFQKQDRSLKGLIVNLIERDRMIST